MDETLLGPTDQTETRISHNRLSNPARRPKKPSKAKWTCRRISVVSLIIALVCFLVFLNFYFQNLYYDLYLLTKDVIEKGNFQTFLSIFVINLFLQMCFVPGISFFIIFVGFITKDYLYSVALIYPSTILICSLTFALTRLGIKDWLHKVLHRKWYFKMYYDLSLERPWRTSFLLRVLLIPVTYKNYLISLMSISFAQFIVPACLYYLPYFSSYIIIGMLISSVQDILNGKIPDQDKRFYYGLITFYSVLVLISIGILVYLIVLTRRMYRKFKREQIENDIGQENPVETSAD